MKPLPVIDFLNYLVLKLYTEIPSVSHGKVLSIDYYTFF